MENANGLIHHPLLNHDQRLNDGSAMMMRKLTEEYETSISSVKGSAQKNYSLRFHIESDAERFTSSSTRCPHLIKNSPVYFSSRNNPSNIQYSENINLVGSSSCESYQYSLRVIDSINQAHQYLKASRTEYKRSEPIHPFLKWLSDESLTDNETSQRINAVETLDIADVERSIKWPSDESLAGNETSKKKKKIKTLDIAEVEPSFKELQHAIQNKLYQTVPDQQARRVSNAENWENVRRKGNQKILQDEKEKPKEKAIIESLYGTGSSNRTKDRKSSSPGVENSEKGRHPVGPFKESEIHFSNRRNISKI
ncbi:hypothetical protein AVEN_258530-1 [Araneus ventricosus]|uniref:Uncharacterized protein n=1 Tax=Araneus ventricosus TaxID=182803 RepID=A0A4Y2I4X3_ARAVE|nr:hypothetical protein AVEN_258530-1 [Araneus ventricosus]